MVSMKRIMIFCLLLISSLYVQGMDTTCYDYVPVFCTWVLAQENLQLHKDVRRKILQSYIKEKRVKCERAYGDLLKHVDFSFVDLMMLKEEYIKGIDILSYAWLRDVHIRYLGHGTYGQCTYGELTKEEYQHVCGLPMCLKSKFNIDRINEIKVLVDREVMDIVLDAQK